MGAYIVGNPPFIGNKRMRFALGDGYTESLRAIFGELSENVDYVMYWWHHAAQLLESKCVNMFGLITTNSIGQSSNRAVIKPFLTSKSPLSIRYAVPDHPWVDSASGAQVRIAMTVVDATGSEGVRESVVREYVGDDGLDEVELKTQVGLITPDLRIGANVGNATKLESNVGLSFMGMTLVGDFRISPEEVAELGYSVDILPAPIKRYSNGRELSQISQRRFVIDFYGTELCDATTDHPSLIQRVVDHVKPLRDQNKRDTYKKNWWIFGEPRKSLRDGIRGLERYIVTLETSKHRYFLFLPGDYVPDHSLFVVASDQGFDLGVLSSKLHVLWSKIAGSRLGVGNDLRWRNATCFDPFPYPISDDANKKRIGELAEQLDAHRKRQQEQHPTLTMTGMYNVLEKLRSGEKLTAKEQTIHEQGLVSVLKRIHDDLDEAVFDAYGWPHDLDDEAILHRLVDLNHERAEEESRGIIRWLRPEFQDSSYGKKGSATQTAFSGDDKEAAATKKATTKIKKQPWPKTLPERMVAIQSALQRHTGPAASNDIAAYYTRANKADVAELLETLAIVGNVRQLEDGRFAVYK